MRPLAFGDPTPLCSVRGGPDGRSLCFSNVFCTTPLEQSSSQPLALWSGPSASVISPARSWSDLSAGRNCVQNVLQLPAFEDVLGDMVTMWPVMLDGRKDPQRAMRRTTRHSHQWEGRMYREGGRECLVRDVVFLDMP